MCYKVQCRKCNKFTWSGCGMHKDSILATISLDQRCTCRSIKQLSPSQRYQQTSSNFTYFTGSSRYP